MSRKSFAALGLLLLAGLLFWSFQLQPVRSPVAPVSERWLPGLQGARVRAIEVQRPGQPLLRLERREQGWVVPAKAQYPARGAAAEALLAALSAARKLQPSVQELQFPSSAAHDPAPSTVLRVRLDLADGAPLVLLLGSADAVGGQPVRQADQQQTWLIDRPIELPANELHWLDRRISAIPFASVRELQLRYLRGEALTFYREQPDGPLQLRQLPSGRRLADAARANGPAQLFADLEFGDAAPLAQIGFSGAPALQFRLQTFAGGQLQGRVFLQGGQHWLTLQDGRGLSRAELPGKLDWAYRLEPEQYRRLAKKLTDLLAAE